MRKTILALLITASVLALSACSDKSTNDEVLATTKEGNITKADLYEEMKNSIGSQAFENLVLKKAIESEHKVSDEELKEAIQKQKDQYGDNFEQTLEQNNMTEDFFEKQVEFSLLQQKLIQSLEEVTDEQLQAEYDKMKKEVHARHILLEDKETAEDIIAKLKDGEDFAELAKEHSTEPAAEESGGDLGWFGPGRMVQPFDEAVFALPENEISEPVKTSFGYHVIEVLETREAELDESFEELKPKLEENIKKKQFDEKLASLIQNVDVTIKDDSLKNVLDPFLGSEGIIDYKRLSTLCCGQPFFYLFKCWFIK